MFQPGFQALSVTELFGLIIFSVLRSLFFILTVDLLGATVRVSQAADVPRPGARSTRHLRPQSAHHPHSVYRPFAAGHHLQAAPTQAHHYG